MTITPRRQLKRAALLILAIALGLVILVAGVFLFGQRYMVFPGVLLLDDTHPTPSHDIVRLEFVTTQGDQMSYYRPPANDSTALPSPLWVCFNGNAAPALSWAEFFHGFPDEDAGFLFIEYPGYMGNPGNPSPRNIREAADHAFETLAQHLDIERPVLEGDIATLGFSIGSATSLEFAARHPVHTVMVLAPFTRAVDMASHFAPPPFHHLMLHRFDNVARLEEILSRAEPPPVYLFHGDADEIIPVEHGRRIAETFPQIHYREVPGADHNFLMYDVRDEIWAIMASASENGMPLETPLNQ